MVPTLGTDLAKILKLKETERTKPVVHSLMKIASSLFLIFLKYPKLVGSFIRSF
jgi:hypothetical protein